MPGNEVGDRVHNFFGQENLSQVYQSQITDGNWLVLNNNLWSGNQRQINAPFASNLKNFAVQQSDVEHGHSSQSLHPSHGLNLTQLAQHNQRPESGKSQPQNPDSALNGYMRGHQLLQSRQNEANFFWADSESNRNNLTPRPLLEPEGNGHELYKKNLARLDGTMSPMNFDCSGAQQQITGWHSGALQGLPGQHSGINDMQLLQQQLMLTQMQELYRRQQLQSLEGRQHNSMNQAASITKPAVGSQSSPLINGIPINEASNVMWPPDVMTANANWMQPNVSQGSSGGLVSPEQGQAMRMMGFVPQQVDRSLYGLPVSSSRGTSHQYSHFQVEKAAIQQISADSQYPQVQTNNSVSPQVHRSTNSFPVQQYAAFSGQANTRDRSSISGQDIQRKSTFRPSGQGSNSGLSIENLQQLNNGQRTGHFQESNGRQELAGSAEALQEKPAMHVPPSQSVATLDATEEKILFGSDDNLWEAFGSNSGFGIQDSTECLNGIPSLQSGSWSALMQSAVAETSSSDVGVREEWSSLTFNNVERPLSLGMESGKKQQVWAENNSNMSFNSKSRLPVKHEEPKILDSSINHSGRHGFHHPGFTSRNHHDKFQTDSSHCSTLPFPDRDKWVGSSPMQNLAEGNDMYASVANSSTLENHGKKKSGSWSHQPTSMPCSSSGEPSTRQNTWNLMESVSPDTNTSLKHVDDEKPHHKIDHERAIQEVGQVFGMWRPGSSIRPSTSNLQVFGGDSGVTAQNSASRVNPEGVQQIFDGRIVDTWRDVDSPGSSRGNDGPGKYQHHLENRPQVVELSKNNSMDRRGSDRHEMENSSRKDSSTEGNISNAPQHAVSHLGETSRLNAGDSRIMLELDSKSSGQVNQRSVGSRRFQYHPMGDLEVDADHYHGKKLMTHAQPFSQPMPRDQGYIGQLNSGPTNRNLIETEKVEAKDSDEIGLKSLHSAHRPKSSAPFDRSIIDRASIKTSSSQNMLELLPKVEHRVRGRGIAFHLSPDYDPSSGMAVAETSEGSIMHTQKNQGFGLQLGPPAQRFPVQEHDDSPHNSPQTDVNFHNITPEIGALEGPIRLTAMQPVAAQGEVMNYISGSSGQICEKFSQYNVQGNFPQAFPSSFPFPRIHAQNQSVAGFSRPSFDRSAPNAFDISGGAAHVNHFATVSTQDSSLSNPQKNCSSSVEITHRSCTDQINTRESPEQIRADSAPASQPQITVSLSEQVASPKVYNVWTSVPNKPHSFNSSSFAVKNFEMLSGLRKSNSHDTDNEGKSAPRFDSHTSPSQSSGSKGNSAKESSEQQAMPEDVDVPEKTMSASHGKEPLTKLTSDASHLSTASQCDIEAFGRTLRPNNILHLNHPPLQHTQIMRGIDNDLSNRSNKRIKSLDGRVESGQLPSSNCQQSSYGYNTISTDRTINDSDVPEDDTKLLSFPSGPGDSGDANASSQDMMAFGQKNSSSFYSGNNATSVRGEQSLISPQMAPSWFDQYGMFKNGKMLSAYDMRKMAPPKLLEQAHVGKDSDNLYVQDSVETVNTATTARYGSTLASVSSENMPSRLLIPDITDRNVEAMSPKKRKSSTSGLEPWHRVLVRGSEMLQNISAAELDWAKASSRLIEKVEVDGEAMEDLPPTLKSKRRLVLTTQLMQQILRPPSSSDLSADVKLYYESVAYSVARLTLGDACRAMSCLQNEIVTSTSNTDLGSAEQKKSSIKIGDEYLLKVVEDFFGRAKKLENDILRADSRSSILDIRLECQDLERFSVINRFARFHGRGQADGAETSSSSDLTGNIQKSCLQKYVNAVTMPKNLPDRVHCLSL